MTHHNSICIRPYNDLLIVEPGVDDSSQQYRIRPYNDLLIVEPGVDDSSQQYCIKPYNDLLIVEPGVDDSSAVGKHWPSRFVERE